MAIIKGNAVANATSYELYEVIESGYTVTIQGGCNSNNYPFFVDNQRVYYSEKEQVFTNVLTIRLDDNGEEESEYVMDGDYNEILHEGESLTLTKDIVITSIDH